MLFRRLKGLPCKKFKGFTLVIQRANSTKFTETTDPFLSTASETIDVRSSEEYNVDHIAGAINLPVLDNKERKEVGTMYCKDSFSARKTGAGLVTKNISHLIDSFFVDKPKDYCPLIYCFRGGQRSKSLAVILSEIGFPVYVLTGGYKAYRKRIKSDLETLPLQFDYKVLTGLTGTGKTYILNKLEDAGHQVLDLEGVARHKGSLLGLMDGETQPSQKYWETLLRTKLACFDSSKPVWVESESSKIGNLYIPKVLFSKMCEGKRYRINLPLEERVKVTFRDYSHWMEEKNHESLNDVMSKLTKYYGKEKIKYLHTLISERNWEEFVKTLLSQHYDPLYLHSQKKNKKSIYEEDVYMEDQGKENVDKLIQYLANSS